MKANQIEACLGPFTREAEKFVGIDVTLGTPGRKVGDVTNTRIVDGMVRATISIKDEYGELIHAFLVDDRELLRPKIELNLAPVPVKPMRRKG